MVTIAQARPGTGDPSGSCSRSVTCAFWIATYTPGLWVPSKTPMEMVPDGRVEQQPTVSGLSLVSEYEGAPTETR